MAWCRELGHVEAEFGDQYLGGMEADAGDLVESRDLAQRVLTQAAAQNDPARRIDAAKELVTKPPSGVSERDRLATHLRAMAVLLRDVEVLATGADDRALANADVRPALERLTNTYHGTRGEPFGSPLPCQRVAALQQSGTAFTCWFRIRRRVLYRLRRPGHWLAPAKAVPHGGAIHGA